YGLDGAVTRYRSWSQARDVLANGGRIAMSVGPPLYSGHLIMLAGFDENGRPIVHDPAKSEGYAYKFSEYSLSKSWFDKGGIAYTFYPEDSSRLTGIEDFASELVSVSQKFKLFDNYPNPFNSSTKIEFAIPDNGRVVLQIIGTDGKIQTTLINDYLEQGYHKVFWRGQNHNGSSVASGIYFINIQYKGQQLSKPITLIK
ncbi:MAG TPA: papain-like cysteine protease family protein, partial [bacterium]|nr:papain-like cysteine protease family protein [bacterium]